jgi:hypothetical protein
VADQNRFVNNPSEIVVNVVPFLVPNNADNPIEKGNVTIRLHRSCAKDAAKTVFARSRIGLAWRTWRSNGFGHRAVVGRPSRRPGAAAMAFLLVAGLAFGVSQPAGATGTTRYVSTSAVGSDTSCSSPGYSTIQSAVTAASSGDTIVVCAGTYAGAVVNAKALTFQGANIGVAGATQSGPESIVSSIGVTNANVTIDGFEIDPGSSGSGVALSFTGGTSETVQDNIITDYGYDSAVAQGTEGVTLLGTSGMLFQDNLVENPTPTGQVQYTNAAAQDGFYAGAGVSNNTQILNNVFEGASTYPGTDIGLSYTSGTNPVISGNVSTGGATLVTLFSSSGAQISGNSFTSDPNVIGTGSVIYIGGGDTNTTISDNTVSGGYFGVALRNVYGDGPNEGTTTVTGNALLDDYGGGISLSGTAIDANSTVVAHGNNLGGYAFTSTDTSCDGNPATCGISNSTIFTVNATNNYWGSASGPYNASSNPSATGSPVTANVTFSPWWTTSNGLPTVPTAVSALAGNGAVSVSWTAPALSGTSDATIASYTVSASGGGSQTCTTTATSCTVNGLTNGVSYTLSVSATTNSLATGAAASVTALPVLPPAPPPTNVPTNSLGAPTSVNASPTVPVTISQISGGASAAVTVPAGALPSGTTVSVYPVIDAAPLVAEVPAGQSYVVSLVVAWQAPDGTSPVAAAPITMSVSDPGIKAGDTIYEVTTAGLEAVGTATVDGTATITFSSDPTFLIAATVLFAQSALTITTRTGTLGSALALLTSGGSGTGAITFTAANGTASGCAISGSSLTATSAGTCLVTSTKAGDATHLSVSSPPTTITLAPAPPARGPANAPPPTNVPTNSLGAPTSVNASPTVPVTISQISGGASAAVTVPAGALPSGTTVSVYPVIDAAPLVAEVPAGQSYVVSLVVAWQAPDGTSPVAAAPITMSVSDPGIKAGDTIYEVTTAGLEAVGTATVDGTATITFSSDPTFLIAATVLFAQSALTITTRTGTLGSALALLTSGGSGTGAITFTAANGTASGCAISGSSLTATSAGTCLVTSTKAGDATHLSVSSPPTTITLAAKALPVTLMVRGHAVAGKTVILTISGSGFYGRPMVMARAGTTVVVTHVTAALLTVRVTVKAGSINGVYSFTIRLANGKSYKVMYTQG